MVDLHLPSPEDVVKAVTKVAETAEKTFEEHAPGWAVDLYKELPNLPRYAPVIGILPTFIDLNDVRDEVCQNVPGIGMIPGLCPGGDKPSDGVPGTGDGNRDGGDSNSSGSKRHYDESNFDELGPNAAEFLRSAKAQSVDIEGDQVRIKLTEGFSQEVGGNKLKFSDEISFRVAGGDGGEMIMSDIHGIKAEVGGPLGSTLEVSIKEMRMRQENGKTEAAITADTPIGEKTQKAEVPADIFELTQNLLGEETATA